MAYNDGVKLTAYTFYLQGLGFEEAARKTRSVHKLKSLKGQTVEAWCASGGWEKSRDDVRTQVRKHHEHEAESLLSQLHTKSETILESIYTQLTDSAAPKVSSFEGAAYAFKGLAEFLLALDKRKGESAQPIMVMHALFDVLQGIPSIRNELKKHWPKIQAEIAKRIGLPISKNSSVGERSRTTEVDVTPALPVPRKKKMSPKK